jgi:hypothetical protein
MCCNGSGTATWHRTRAVCALGTSRPKKGFEVKSKSTRHTSYFFRIGTLVVVAVVVVGTRHLADLPLVLYYLPLVLYCRSAESSRTHTHMHIYIHTYIHTHKHTYNARMHACMHACMHAVIHACVHTYIHTFIHCNQSAWVHTYIHACMHTHIHACMHTHRAILIGFVVGRPFQCI